MDKIKGEGCIGLTQAGSYLDLHLTKTNPPYKHNIIKLTISLNKTIRISQRFLLEMPQNNGQYILNLIREDYLKKLNNLKEKKNIDELSFSLMRNYIYTLTKIDFIPSTKTQKRLNNWNK